MRLRHPALGFAGLLVLGVLGLSLVRGDIGLAEAGQRGGIVFAVLFGLDRYVVPLLSGFLTKSSTRPDELS